MAENASYEQFELTRDFLEELQLLISKEDTDMVRQVLGELHPADIAEIYEELTLDEAKFTFHLLDHELAADVLAELEKAWQVAYPIKVQQKRTETKPEFVNLVSPADLVLIFVFSVAGEEFSGNIHICTHFLMLEPVKDRLSSRYLREKDRAHAFRNQLTVLLRDTRVNMVAELGRTVSTIGRILELEIDDVIKINTGPQDAVVVKVEGTPKYFGMPGTLKGNRAIQISALIKKDEGD